MASGVVMETHKSIIRTFELDSGVALNTIKTGTIVKLTSGGDQQVELADSTASPVGVVHAPGCKMYFKAGDSVAVISTGTVYVEADAAIASGDSVKAVLGKADVAAAGDYIIGVALTNAVAAGDIISVQLEIGKI